MVRDSHPQLSLRCYAVEVSETTAKQLETTRSLFYITYAKLSVRSARFHASYGIITSMEIRYYLLTYSCRGQSFQAEPSF